MQLLFFPNWLYMAWYKEAEYYIERNELSFEFQIGRLHIDLSL